VLSFAQFEREVTGERIRDKIAASKAKGMWMGGFVPLGYEASQRTLAINEPEAETVRTLFRLYLELGCVRRLKLAADGGRLVSKSRVAGRNPGGRPFTREHLYAKQRLSGGGIRIRTCDTASRSGSRGLSLR